MIILIGEMMGVVLVILILILMILILNLMIKVINFFGLQDNLTEYLDLLKNCDSDDSQESKVFEFVFVFYTRTVTLMAVNTGRCDSAD